jgi:hypothetical protein
MTINPEEEFKKTAQQMASENAKLRKDLETARANLVSFHLATYDFEGSVKDKLYELKLPDGAVPIGFDIIIQDIDTREQHREFWLDSTKETLQSEWIDDEHTHFVAVINGKLKRYQVITRVYCLCPKAAGFGIIAADTNTVPAGMQ